MVEVTQICVALQNRPGMFAKLCGLLRSAAVDVVALFVSDDQQCCWVNLVVEPTSLAERALEDAGYKFFTEKVLILKVRDQTVGLEQIAARLAQAGVNIEYVYGSAGFGTSFNLVLKVSDQEAAQRVLSASETTAATRA